jgi:serine/threonine protein kinase
MLVLELCEIGGLYVWLRTTTGSPPDTGVLVRILQDVAKGMAYLSARQFVHRDLASRNVLLTRSMVAKM